VIGLQHGEHRTVWLCEVITHIRGVLYGSGYAATVAKVRDKIDRARDFAATTFPADGHRYEIWSPVVPRGAAAQFDALAEAYTSANLDVVFVVNDRYTHRVQELVEHARSSTKATNEPAYRLLQILTRLRGGVRL
jgi:hypothetical protein